MNIHTKAFGEISQFSDRDQAYQAQDPRLAPFYLHRPELSSFKAAIAEKVIHDIDRNLLVDVLQQQYTALGANALQDSNIKALAHDRTFTIITAHQPSLLTGPMYYMYKIASVIHLCKRLAAEHPGYQFVPVFVSGGEDHDFEEINHTHLFRKQVAWNREASGPVGRLSLDGLESILTEFEDILGSSAHADDARQIVATAFAQSSSYGEFSRRLINALFSEHGLLVMSMDDTQLKGRFVPVMRRELFESFSQSLIEATQEQLGQAGFKSQAYSRSINLFYMLDGMRERIEREGDDFMVVNTDLRFSAEEMEAELTSHPERFSPNVNLRPLYQETIMPNLAYVGGGGELAYWLERRSQFEAAGVPYPMLIRRASALVVDRSSQKALQKLGLSWTDTFEPSYRIVQDYLAKASSIDLDFGQQRESIAQAYEQLAERAAEIDPGLSKALRAEQTRQIKNLEQWGGRLSRAVKSKEDTSVKQIEKVVDRLFPGQGLQERHDNVFQYYASSGSALLNFIIDHLDPLARQFYIIEL